MQKILLGLIGILAIAGCHSTQSQEQKTSGIAVRTEAVEVAFLSRPAVTSGIVSSQSRVNLSFKIGGILQTLYVREGESVRQGDLLADLKPDEIEGEVRQAREGYEKAERDHQRVQTLYEEGAASLAQLQDAETGLSVAQSRLEVAEFNHEHAVIRAPEDGFVLRHFAEENELIGGGQPVLMFGTSRKGWVVKAGVTDWQVAGIQVGDSAWISFDAFPGQVCTAQVMEIAGTPDPGIGTYELELSLGKNLPGIRNGFIANVTVYPSATRRYWLVPVESIVEADGPDGFVFSITPDSLARKIPVSLEFIHGERVAISTGLDQTDQVVTDGAGYLKDGNQVFVLADEEPPS